MPPKVQKARRARREVAPVEEVPITSPTKKRGRPAKDNVDKAIQDATEPPRKRGRPAKAMTEAAFESTKLGRGRKSDAPALAVPATTPNKGRGRPKRDTQVAEVAKEPPTAPRGRPRKEVITEPAQTPRGRGRPPKSQGLDLNVAAGSPRVSKRSSARSKTTTPAAVAAGLDPRPRTKLRARLPPAKASKAEPVPKPGRRGRPPKKAAKAPVAKKAVGRKAAETAVSKPTKPAKPVAPRKMRGHTLRQIPDKFVAQVDQYLHDLMQAESNSPPAKHDQDQDRDQGHNTEDEVDVDGKENLEPISASTGDQDQEEAAEDAGTEPAHAQDRAVDQDSNSAADEGEPALNESGEPERDMQSKLDKEFATADDGNDDEVLAPADEIDIPNENHENRADMALMEDREGYVHETLVAATTIITAQ